MLNEKRITPTESKVSTVFFLTNKTKLNELQVS